MLCRDSFLIEYHASGPSSIVQSLDPRSNSDSTDAVPSVPAAWHPHKSFVATNVKDQVQIFDMSSYSTEKLQEGMKGATTISMLPEPVAVLEHELQKKVT
jgi:hypothetical protein